MESDILRAIALRNRNKFQASLLNATEEEAVSILLGYEPSSGMLIVGDTNGSVDLGQSITNGAIALNQSVRRRDGQIPKIDSTPRTRRNPLPKSPTPSEDIIVGVLCNIDPTFAYPAYAIYYKTSTSLYSISYPYYNQGFYSEIIGLFIGVLKNNIITERSLITLPTFPSTHTFNGNYTVNSLECETYYSMGYLGQILKYICNFELPYSETEFFDVANVRLKVINFNIKEKTITTDDFTFTNTTPVISTAFNFLSQKQRVLSDQYYIFVRVIKYQSSTGQILHTLISGTYQDIPLAGLIAWDMGSIDNFQSRSNIASYFGFNWQASTANQQAEAAFRVYDAYGCVGGIVVKIVLEGQAESSYDVFVPEEFLKGMNGVDIPSDRLIFSGVVHLKDLVTGLSLTTRAGVIPTPLEKRDFIAPYIISKYPVDENGRQKRLVLYSLFNKDSGKQVFG